MDSYKALYRKYRPKNFDEIKGQDHIITTLKNILNFDKLSHAYLFSGPRGTGKTSVAKIFAATLNCEHEKEKAKICDNCIVNLNNNLDIIEIDAASNNGIDEIRDLREKVKYSPSKYKYKVYIIDEVHMLTKAAFNALLKTLEEPPKHAIFILATTNPQKIPLTVISRVQRFNFKRITIPILEEQLKAVLVKENIKINYKALNLIAKMAEGGLRDALSIADQISIYSNNNITEKEINEVFSLVSVKEQINLINLIYKKNTTKLLSLISSFVESGVNIEKLIINLIDVIRDYIVYFNTHSEALLEYLNVEEINYLEIDINFAYEVKDALIPLLNDLKYNEIPSRSFEIAMLELLYNNNRKEIIEEEKTQEEWSSFFNDEDIINLKTNTVEQPPFKNKIFNEKNTENNEENKQVFNFVNDDSNNVHENKDNISTTKEISDTLGKILNTSENEFRKTQKIIQKQEKSSTDEILNNATQSLNIQNEIINEQEQINESILGSTDELDLSNVVIDTGEIDITNSSNNDNFRKTKIIENAKQDSEYFSFNNLEEEDKITEEFSNPFEKNIDSEYRNPTYEDNNFIEAKSASEFDKTKTITEIFNSNENNIQEDKETNVEEFDITDLLNKQSGMKELDNYYANKLSEKEVVNLFLQIDSNILKNLKQEWKNLFTYKLDEKFSKLILYLENSSLIAASADFIIVSSKTDDLIFKLNDLAKEKEFKIFLEKLSNGPKHFFAITKDLFKRAKKLWKNIQSKKEEFDIVKLPKLNSFSVEKKDKEEFAKTIFGDTLEIK